MGDNQRSDDQGAMVEERRRRCSECGAELSPPAVGICAACVAKQRATPSLASDATKTITRSTGAIAESGGAPLPRQIGAYRILSVLGEGGMGIVYLASQEQPIRRQVALKLIKLGMDSRDVIARFESERQALALMDHPNIAKVFDAGRTESGRPYFVMEYVSGISITEYCDRQRLKTRERLELFVAVCDALQHAHQKGIVHRDVKPANVLVSLQNGRPVARVIDFGVAKALHQRLAEHPVFTQQGVLLGTPEYMSPEQAEMSALGIDTTSDVYSLGALLYELLSGEPPFDPVALRRAGYDEIRRIIREEEPLRPSTRLSRLGDTAVMVARRRQTDPRSLQRELGGDLDWITMKAIEKDRTRRYPSASELAADILRHLSDEPVVARPPSTTYRLRKLIRRHKGAVAAVVALIAVLGAGLVVSLFLYARANDAALRALRESYVANIIAADLSLQANASIEARSRLQLTEPAFRGWEWHHLALRTDSSTVTLDAGNHVRSVAFTPDGSRILSQVDGAERPEPSDHLVTWDVVTGKRLGSYAPLGTDVQQSSLLAFSRDGSLILSVDRPVYTRATSAPLSFLLSRPVLRVHDVLSGKAVALPEELSFSGSFGVIGVFSPDATRVAALSSRRVRVWDLQNTRLVATVAGAGEMINTFLSACRPIAFAPDGGRLAFAARENSVLVVEPDSGTVRTVLKGHLDAVCIVAFSPDGRTLFTAARDGSSRVWDAVSGEVLGELQAQGEGTSAAFSPDGGMMAVGSTDGSLRVFEPPRFGRSSDVSVLFGHEASVQSVAFSPDGRWITSGSIDDTIRIWDASFTGRFRLFHAGARFLASLAMTPDGQHIVSAEGPDVRVWDSYSGDTVAMLKGHDSQVTAVAVSPDGSSVVSSSLDHTVRLWRLNAGRTSVPLRGHKGGVYAVAFSPTGSFVVSGGADRTVRMWEAASGRPLALLDGHTGAVTSVAVSRDGALVVSGSEDKSVKIWSTSNKRLVRTLAGHGATVLSVALSRDGRWVLSGSDDGTLRLWSAATGTMIAVLRGHSGGVTTAAFNSDASRVVSGSVDGTVRVWNPITALGLVTLRSSDQGSVSSVFFNPDDTRIVSGWYGGGLRVWESKRSRWEPLARDGSRSSPVR